MIIPFFEEESEEEESSPLTYTQIRLVLLNKKERSLTKSLFIRYSKTCYTKMILQSQKSWKFFSKYFSLKVRPETHFSRRVLWTLTVFGMTPVLSSFGFFSVVRLRPSFFFILLNPVNSMLTRSLIEFGPL